MSLKPSAGAGSGPEWTKSSYSTNDGPECVEVAAADEAIWIRDSKDPQGPRLAVAPAAWTAFVAYAARCEV